MELKNDEQVWNSSYPVAGLFEDEELRSLYVENATGKLG